MSAPSDHAHPPASLRTPLHEAHLALGARMVDFAGWQMPVQYPAGVLEEHKATRERAGLFDVSHMGEFDIKGREALEVIDRLTPNDVKRLVPGRAHYSALTTPQGTFVDDIIVYCRAENHYLVVVNASNAAKDFAWIGEHAARELAAGTLSLTDLTKELSLLAVQGPKAAAILGRLVAVDLTGVGYFHLVETAVAGVEGCILARTGYTGEDGFEVFAPWGAARQVWDALLAAGQRDGIQPCGLGARDTLRLEAKLPLYGNDIDDTTTVIEADLGFIVRPNKGEFLGREILGAQKAGGAPRKLVGFELTDRGIARQGYPVRLNGKPVGMVTSGTHSPTLGRSIGLVYLPREESTPGTEIEVEIRGRAVPGQVVKTPFVPHRTLAAGKA